MKTNTGIYNSLSEALARVSIAAVKEYETSQEPVESHIKVRRALGSAVKDFVHFESTRIDIEDPPKGVFSGNQFRDYEKHLKQKAAYLLAEQLLKRDLIQVEEVDAFANLGLPRSSYVLTLPVFKWNKEAYYGPYAQEPK